MPDIRPVAGWLGARFFGVLPGLFLSATVQAFTLAQVPLLNAADVAPNVMLLLDNSENMNSIVHAPGFDPTVERPALRRCARQEGHCLSGAFLGAASVSLADLDRSGCGNGYVGFYRGTTTPLCLKLPDPVGNGQTGYFTAYLAYLVALAGGKSFYAVQLYSAVSGNAPQALWEINAPASAMPDDPFNDLGYAYARTEVARLADGRWVAFIGNGYDSHSGAAALFVVDMRDGSLIRKIVVDRGGRDNGLSAVKLQVDNQNVVQAAYGGDLKGQLWTFDLSASSPGSWAPAFAGVPLFTTARDGSQPITSQPLLEDHPLGGQLVLVGTGKFNELADKRSQSLPGFYAVWDSAGGAGAITPGDLQAQSVTGAFSGSATYLTSSREEVSYPLEKGWYLPLKEVGERVLSQATMVAGRIVFSTADMDADDPCASGGSGRLIELDGFSGKMLDDAVLDTNGDEIVDSLDKPSSGVFFTGGIPSLNAVVNRGARKIVSDSGGGLSSLVEKPGGESRRIMWRQIQ